MTRQKSRFICQSLPQVIVRWAGMCEIPGVGIFSKNISTKYNFNSLQKYLISDLISQPGKIAVITGGARGIGAEVVKMLMKCDITVIIGKLFLTKEISKMLSLILSGCRNVQAAEMLLKKYRDEGINTGHIDAFQLDISYLDSVRNFAAEVAKKYPKIHYLINNGNYCGIII